MSKKAVEVPSEAGPYEPGKNPKRPERAAGPYHNSSKHELPAKSDGAFEAKNKPLVHAEGTNQHNGRKHPAVDRLPGAELLGGKLRKADETSKEKK